MPELADGADPDAAPSVPYGPDGQLPNGSYAVDHLVDVKRRPGVGGRAPLNVLIQFHGCNPATGQPWDPEWHPLSMLSPSQRGEARLMEREKYSSAAGPPPAEPVATPSPNIITDYFGETSTQPSLSDAELAALRTLRPVFRAHLDRLLILPATQRATTGPSSILCLQEGYHFMLFREGHWARVSADSPSFTSAERRRCRSACLALGLPDLAARL